MTLLDEEDINKPQKKKKLKSMIIVSIIVLSIIFIGILILLLYIAKNPNEDGVYINGKIISSDIENLFIFQKDENGNDKIYIAIREFAKLTNSSLKYSSYKGDYNPKTEDDSKCYIIKENREVTIYTKDSDIIYKLNLENNSSEYEKYKISNKVFYSNGQLYTSINGIEKGFNVSILYDEKNKNKIKIESMDNLILESKKRLDKMSSGEYGKLSAETSTMSNAKTVFENLLIVKTENNQYGIAKVDNSPKFILEPKYDNISYICESESFLVSSNQKNGIFSKEGKMKIDILYDEIISMGQDYGFYIVKLDNKYGVVDGNGKIIIHPENEKIGIDISAFTYNNVKNGFVLLNKLIPVKKKGLWAFYDTNGKLLTDKEKFYKSIGCINTNGETNTYSLLEIPECDVVVVQDTNDKYSFVNTQGDDTILPFVFNSIYIKVVDGERKFLMQRNEKKYDVVETLKIKFNK